MWILNHYAVPLSQCSGTRHFDLSVELVNKGYQVTIFSSSFDHKNHKESLKKWQIYRTEISDGVRFVFLRTIPYRSNGILRIANMISFMIGLLLICPFFKRPGTILASSFHPFTWISGWILSKIKRARYMVEIRDLWPQTAIDMGAMREQSFIARALRKLELFACHRADKVIVLFSGAVAYYVDRGVDPEKIEIIPNGVRPVSFKTKGTESRYNREYEHTRDLNAIYIGAHGQANALHVIIGAAKILQDRQLDGIRFSFYGDGPEKDGLMKLAEELQLANVSFFPAIPKKDVPAVLAGADVGLVSLLDIPLYRYGMSLNKLFDYMGAGLPVVFAGQVSNDIVRESGGGLSVPPENPEALADAIAHMASLDPAERQSLGDKGRQYVMDNHNMAKLADKLESLLR